jgi:hypothetical protein
MSDKKLVFTHWNIDKDDTGVWKIWRNKKDIVAIKRIE